MSIEVAIRSLLLAAPAVAAIVADRVWFVTRPQNERRDGVVLSLASALPQHGMEGPADWTSGTVRLDALADSYQASKVLAAALVAAVDGYGGGTVEGVKIGFLEVESIEDIEAAPLEGRAVPTFGTSIEVNFLTTT